MPETHDLDRQMDRAFEALTRDVTTVTHGPGAGAAVRTARRRRTALGAAAAVALVAVAGTALTQVGGSPESAPGPAGEGTRAVDSAAGALPEPAPLTARRLDQASSGWVTGWTDRDPASDDIGCVAGGRGEVRLPEPVAADNDGFSVPGRNGKRAGLVYARFDRSRTAASAYDRYRAFSATCYQVVGAGTYEPGLAEWEVLSSPERGRGSAPETLVVARVGDRLAALSVEGAGRPSPATAGALADAVIGGLRDAELSTGR